MPKRRRLWNTPKKSPKPTTPTSKETPPDFKNDKEMRTARGRLMGALLDVLEADSSDDEPRTPQRKKERSTSSDDDEDTNNAHQSARQSYVLKLFDRSVDLSQFSEETPLYPICRAWILNKPKANYKELSIWNNGPKPSTEKSVELPGPQGPVISRIPPLTEEQSTRDKNNINLDYQAAPPPTRSELITEHITRWSNIRSAWLRQARAVEARYEDTQKVLSSICTSNL